MKRQIGYKVAALAVILWASAAVLPAQVGYMFLECTRLRTGDGSPYVLVQYSVGARDLAHKATNGGFQAKLRIRARVLRLPDSTRVWTDEVVLDGPILADTNGAARHYFLQFASKVPLANGRYAVVADYQDAERPGAQTFTLVREMDINATQPEQRHQSDIQFIVGFENAPPETVNPFVRNGLYVMPNPVGTNYINADTMKFLMELYKLDELAQGAGFFLRGHIQAANTGQAISGHNFSTRPRVPTAFEPIFIPLSITNLPSSKYILVVEVCKNGGEVLLRQTQPFYVVNNRTQNQSPDALAMYNVQYGYTEAQLDSFLQPMMYLANETERNFGSALTTYDEKRIFFYNFWSKRHNPDAQPGFEFFRFREAVEYCDANFRTNIRPGWASDRGRILLMYGPPNATELFDDPMNYQLWYYNSIRGQSNVFFCFSSSERASGEMKLVHSTVRGEPFSTEWAQFLRNVGDAQQDNYGNRPVGLDANPGGGTRFNE